MKGRCAQHHTLRAGRLPRHGHSERKSAGLYHRARPTPQPASEASPAPFTSRTCTRGAGIENSYDCRRRTATVCATTQPNISKTDACRWAIFPPGRRVGLSRRRRVLRGSVLPVVFRVRHPAGVSLWESKRSLRSTEPGVAQNPISQRSASTLRVAVGDHHRSGTDQLRTFVHEIDGHQLVGIGCHRSDVEIAGWR